MYINDNRYTPEEVYEMIVNQNDDFIRALAAISVRRAAETRADMWSQMEDPKPAMPTIEDAKNMSCDFVGDMLTDFDTKFREAVADLHCSVDFELTANIKIQGFSWR